MNLLYSNPDLIWAAGVSQAVRNATQDYRAKRILKNGMVYGESVRTLDLRQLCAKQIDELLTRRSCQRVNDVLKEPTHHQPIKTPEGKTIPMISYLCPDGGVVRMKPMGDPTSRFKRQPLASKALRYPYNSKFDNFDDEIIKIDQQGNPLPKWVKDLNLTAVSEDQKAAYIQDWADDAHTDLSTECNHELASIFRRETSKLNQMNRLQKLEFLLESIWI